MSISRSVLSMAAALMASVAMAQAPAPIMRFSFDEADEGWIGQGTNCRASVTTQSSFNGSGSLKFEYDVRPGAMAMLTFQPTPGELSGVSAFRFWVRADQSATLGFMVQERGGGRYTALFAAPKGKWQKVEISTSDLILSEGADDPKDADGRLNMDRIESLAIGDLSQFLAQMEGSEVVSLLGLEMGPRVLHLDDFSATSEKLPPGFTSTAREARLDTFARPQAAWLATCAAAVERTEGKTDAALVASYRQTLGRIVALMRSVPRGTMKGMSRLSFTVASRQRLMLLLQIEEAGGGKFNTVLEVPEGGAPKAFTIEAAGLTAADDSTVKDRAVKMELANQIVFIDATTFSGEVGDQDNTLRVSMVKAVADADGGKRP